jgi:hypothetical protein
MRAPAPKQSSTIPRDQRSECGPSARPEGLTLWFGWVAAFPRIMALPCRFGISRQPVLPSTELGPHIAISEDFSRWQMRAYPRGGPGFFPKGSYGPARSRRSPSCSVSTASMRTPCLSLPDWTPRRSLVPRPSSRFPPCAACLHLPPKRPGAPTSGCAPVGVVGMAMQNSANLGEALTLLGSHYRHPRLAPRRPGRRDWLPIT